MTTLSNGHSGGQKKKEEPTRKLRSKDKSKNQNNQKTLFNFDNANELLYRNQQISITKSELDPSIPYYAEVSDLPQLPLNGGINTVNPVLPRRSKHIEDPLPDSLYELYHRKMTKEEKVMNNEERLRILSEVDNLQSQLNLLNQYDWVRHLPTIALINDMNDYEELELKKQLSIEEIERLLRKHENWRRRLERLNNDIRESAQEQQFQEEISDDPDYQLSLPQLRTKRAKERRSRYGPVIKLRLTDDTYLIIDPLNTPKIIKGNALNINNDIKPKPKTEPEPEPTPTSQPNSPQKAPQTPMKMNGIVKLKLKPRGTPDNQQTTDTNTIENTPQPTPRRRSRNKIRLEDITDINTIKLDPGDTDFVFGTCYEDIHAHLEGFQLPLRIKRLCNNTNND